MTLADLIGGAIKLMPKEETRELDVCCALSATTFRLAQLSSDFVATRRAERLNDQILQRPGRANLVPQAIDFNQEI